MNGITEMISFEKINILEVRAEVLVNSVNLAGVMGKGIALAIKVAFPDNFALYKKACENKQINIGKIFVTETGQLFPRFIINFPTKKHWRFPSKYEWIEEGLVSLVAWLRENKINSIAIPPLGSGNGKLNWNKVKPIILKYLKEFENNIDIIIIEPFEIPQLEKINNDKEASLTPARAMILFLLNKYKVMGYEVNLLVVQKLAYFLQNFGEPLKLRFEKGHYGPFAFNLIPVLKELKKGFINVKEKDFSRSSTVIRLNPNKIPETEQFIQNNLTFEQKERLEKTLSLVQDFETPFGIELLGTVDFILREKKTVLTSNDIYKELKNWTDRKQYLFKPAYIEVAKDRLSQFFNYQN